MHNQFYITPTISTMTNLENQNVVLSRARAVLAEAIEHCEELPEPGSWQAYYFITRLERLLLLLHVADDYVIKLNNEQLKVIDELQKTIKAEMGEAQAGLTATDGGVDACRKLIISLINGISGEKELRAILFLVQRCLKNSAS